ncbi:hypothetical protein KR044_010831, partial [Drosophila immigrans]
MGEKIRALSKMLEGRRTIHQPMRNLIDNIMELYVAVDEERAGKTSPEPRAAEGKRTREERGDQVSPPPTPKKSRGQVHKPKPATAPQERPQTHQPGVDTNQNKEWRKVPKRARRTKSAKPDAIIVRGSNDVSYADILRSVKAEPKLKELANHVRGIRKTAKGELLFELEKSADPITKGIHKAVQDFLGPSVEVIALTETSVIEVKDIDEVTSEEELLEALLTHFGEVRITKSCIVSFRKAYGGTQTATLRLPV